MNELALSMATLSTFFLGAWVTYVGYAILFKKNTNCICLPKLFKHTEKTDKVLSKHNGISMIIMGFYIAGYTYYAQEHFVSSSIILIIYALYIVVGHWVIEFLFKDYNNNYAVNNQYNEI